MRKKVTYEMGERYLRLFEVAEELKARSESGEDCLGVLCSLSGEGDWETQESGSHVYVATLESDK